MGFVNGVNLLPATGEFTYSTAAHQGARFAFPALPLVPINTYYDTFNGGTFPSRMDEEGRSDVFKVIAKACKSEWPGIIWNGTSASDMRSMLGAAREYLADSFSWEQPFAHKPFHDFEDFERELKWRIEGDNAFAIVGISKPWHHWTCAHRLTTHEMIMTDSCHVKQIKLAKCGLTGDGTDYEFDYHQTFTLMKVAKVCLP